MRPYLLLFLLLIPLARAIEINEIMYNPPGDDNGNEWVEIYNPENLDLTNWTIGDLNSNDTLVAVKIIDSDYAIIVENASLFSDSNASIYSAGSLIGNGLGNTADKIYLYDKSKAIADFVSYNNTLANGNNKTIEKFNNSWHESIISGGTPGFENSVSQIFTNPENYTNETNSTNSTEINITLNETGTNLTNQTNQTENNTANNTNSSQTNATTCVSRISITTTKDIFADEAIKFRHIVNSSDDDFSIEYWVEDLFGNVVKEKYETKTLTEKSYTPHPDESDKVYVIKSILNGCNESYAEKTVIYKTNEAPADEEEATETSDTESGSESEETPKPKFNYTLVSYSEEIPQYAEGNAIVEINSDDGPHEIYITAYIYRYSKKYSDIAEYGFTIEKLSTETSELRFFTNATPGEYKMKIKINKDEQKTDYEITRNVTVVENNDIEPEINETNSTSTVTGQKNETKNQTTSIKPSNITSQGVIYQSKKAESENLVPLIIIGVLALVSGVLIWKR